MEAKDFGKMIRGITSNVNYYISSNIEKYGIKQGQFEYFLLIYSTPGINQLELGKMKNVGKASVTKALKILEEDGFIKRVTDKNDRRNILCYITEKGDMIADELIHIKTNTEKDLFDNFSQHDKELLFEYLSKLYYNSQKLTINAVSTDK